MTISSLVVLPLWGWVRRQFDDRVALVACLLYITHPKFIVESPEVMCDPTFWFFFTLAMYCMWRGSRRSAMATSSPRRGDYARLAHAGGGPVPLDSPGDVDVLAVAGVADRAKKAAGRRNGVRAGLSDAVDANRRGVAVRSRSLGFRPFFAFFALAR